jgi:hypothetical protein
MYCLALIIYTKNAIMTESEDVILYSVILAIGMIYPAGYEIA